MEIKALATLLKKERAKDLKKCNKNLKEIRELGGK